MTSSALALGDLTRILGPTLGLVQQASKEVMAHARAPQARAKDDGSPLTLADLAAHRVLVEGLTPIVPGCPVVSEEAAFPGPLPRCWLVDPLDGTKEFLAGNGEFTVNAALVEDGVPVLGVVGVPARSVAYAGIPGFGAWRIGPPGGLGRLKPAPSPGGPIRVVGSRSHEDGTLSRMLELLRADGHEAVLKPMGSALKFCLVAEGQADIYPRFGPTMWWDTAAAHAVLSAAGGRVTDLQGRPLRYLGAVPRNPMFVACGPSPLPWERWVPLRQAAVHE